MSKCDARQIKDLCSKVKYKYKPFPTRQRRMFNVHSWMTGLCYSALYCLHTSLHLNFGLWCFAFDMFCLVESAYFIQPSPLTQLHVIKVVRHIRTHARLTCPHLTVVDWFCSGWLPWGGSHNNRNWGPRPEQPFPGLQLGILFLWFLLLFLFALLSRQLEGHSGHRGECLCWGVNLQNILWHLSGGHRQ